MKYELKRNDTAPAITATLTDENGVIVLTGATVRFKLAAAPESGLTFTPINRVCTVTNATKGQVSDQTRSRQSSLGRQSIVPDDPSVRRLTPTECERLMGWPDGWTAVDGDKTPDGRRYAACGNGVVANVSEWIGRRIMALDGEL